MTVMLVLMIAHAQAGDPEVHAHLTQVVHTLRAQTPATLPAEQRARRLDLLDVLQGYADAGEYPEHDGPIRAHPRVVQPPRAFDGSGLRAPVFVDTDGSHCAVGYLMAVTDSTLVAPIVASDNDAYLLEMTTPGIGDWAEHHGFTAEELAWIQPEYRPEPMPDCASFEPAPLPAEPLETRADGVGLVVSGEACHECDQGPLRVFVTVGNRGRQPSGPATLTVRLGNTQGEQAPTGEILGTHDLPALGPGEIIAAGTYELPGSLHTLYDDAVDIFGTVQGADLLGEQDWDFVWGPERSQFTTAYPEACDGLVDPVTDPVEDAGGWRCSSAPGGGLSWAPLAALWLLARRRSRPV